MKKILILSLALFPPVCFGATYTVCPGGCNETTIQAVFDNNDLEPGDVVIVASGTYNEQVVWGEDDGGDENNGVILQAAGDCIIDGQQVRDYGILVRDVNHTKTDGFTIRNCLVNGHRIVGTTENGITGAVVTRTSVTNTGPGVAGDVSRGTGFIALQTGYGHGIIQGVEYSQCVSSSNARHGYDTRWRVYATYADCVADGNGKGVLAHGFTTHPVSSKFTAGWTLSGGTVYYRPVVNTYDNERRVYDMEGLRLDRDDSAGVSPAVGKFSVTGGQVYVNFGRDPNGRTIVSIRQPNKSVYTRCRASRTASYEGVDGHGMVTDDSTEANEYWWCTSYDNDGDGFSTLRGANALFVRCVSCNNGRDGFYHFNATGNVYYNNTAVNNTRYSFSSINAGSTNYSIYNNIAYGGITGIYSNSAPPAAEHHNMVYGASSANFSGITPDVSDLQVDPIFCSSVDFHIQETSPARGAASDGGDIGAYEYIAPTCFDGIQNQDETGIDCGGVCPACKGTTVPGAPANLHAH